jgi:hypothetical protein
VLAYLHYFSKHGCDIFHSVIHPPPSTNLVLGCTFFLLAVICLLRARLHGSYCGLSNLEHFRLFTQCSSTLSKFLPLYFLDRHMDTVDQFLNLWDLTLGRLGHKVSRIITYIIDYYSNKCIWEKIFVFTVVGITPPSCR